jgi:hypothetical protein
LGVEASPRPPGIEIVGVSDVLTADAIAAVVVKS